MSSMSSSCLEALTAEGLGGKRYENILRGWTRVFAKRVSCKKPCQTWVNSWTGHVAFGVVWGCFRQERHVWWQQCHTQAGWKYSAKCFQLTKCESFLEMLLSLVCVECHYCLHDIWLQKIYSLMLVLVGAGPGRYCRKNEFQLFSCHVPITCSCVFYFASICLRNKSSSYPSNIYA